MIYKKDGYTYDTVVYKIVYDISITETSPGKYQANMERTVYRDGEEYNMAVFEFVNEYTAETPDEPDKPGKKKPNTGDYTNIVLPVTIFAAALIAFIAMFVIRRKQNSNK